MLPSCAQNLESAKPCTWGTRSRRWRACWPLPQTLACSPEWRCSMAVLATSTTRRRVTSVALPASKLMMCWPPSCPTSRCGLGGLVSSSWAMKQRPDSPKSSSRLCAGTRRKSRRLFSVPQSFQTFAPSCRASKCLFVSCKAWMTLPYQWRQHSGLSIPCLRHNCSP